MKKFFTLAAFVFAVMISSSALAADWAEIETDEKTTKVYVDKNSIKRGVHCAALNVDRSDGFTANIKLEMIFPGMDKFVMINSMGFFEENGAKKKCYLSVIDENGKPVKDDSFKPEVSAADGSDGSIWPAVYEYIQKNLP